MCGHPIAFASQVTESVRFAPLILVSGFIVVFSEIIIL